MSTKNRFLGQVEDWYFAKDYHCCVCEIECLNDCNKCDCPLVPLVHDVLDLFIEKGDFDV